MNICRKVARSDADPLTGQAYCWTVESNHQRTVPWHGFYTGPLALAEREVEHICRQLLGCGLDDVASRVEELLPPAMGGDAKLPALVFHSTTPELKALEGELYAMERGFRPGDLTTYKETRSVYLANPGDLAVGRTKTWQAAVAATGVQAVKLPDLDHYYLSHALLSLAHHHVCRGRAEAIEQILERLRHSPHRARLYAFELEMQIFLCWLAEASGVGRLPVEANRPSVSKAWNRKAVIHPEVAAAQDIEPAGTGTSFLDLLGIEAGGSELCRALGIEVPKLPGYTIRRQGQDAEGFGRQVVRAARLLRERYGLSTGCLKASEAGDGARIVTGLDLNDSTKLHRLGCQAYVHGDDYVLEAHVSYRRPRLAGQELPTAVSAHVRAGEVAPGATLQFVEGTSWKGNVYFDRRSCELFQVPVDCYQRLRQFTHEFTDAFRAQGAGLVLAGVDFAVGTVGGYFGDQVLLGVQDLNVSFTGAECLRAFLDKASAQGLNEEPSYGVTRVYRPLPEADHQAFLGVTNAMSSSTLRCDTVASIPGRWAMVAITGKTPQDALANLQRLEKKLHGLIAQE